MTQGQKAEQAWENESYYYCDASGAYRCAISDFKSSLKREIEKQYNEKLEKSLSTVTTIPIGTKTPSFSLDEVLELLNTVEP